MVKLLTTIFLRHFEFFSSNNHSHARSRLIAGAKEGKMADVPQNAPERKFLLFSEYFRIIYFKKVHLKLHDYETRKVGREKEEEVGSKPLR